MSKYLADTTVLVDHFRGKRNAGEFLGSKKPTISFISLGECTYGARNKKELELIQQMLRQFNIEWGSAEINQLAIKLLADYYLKYGLQFLDAIIAAMAINKGYVLITDNIKHFRFIPKLKVLRLSEINL